MLPDLDPGGQSPVPDDAAALLTGLGRSVRPFSLRRSLALAPACDLCAGVRHRFLGVPLSRSLLLSYLLHATNRLNLAEQTVPHGALSALTAPGLVGAPGSLPLRAPLGCGHTGLGSSKGFSQEAAAGHQRGIVL